MEGRDKDKRKNSSINLNILFNLLKNETYSKFTKHRRVFSSFFSNPNFETIQNNISKSDIKENEDFSQMIMKKFDDIKNYFISLFQDQIIKINKNYNNFINQIIAFISSKEKIVANITEPERNIKEILKYITKNIFENLLNTMEIYCNIFNNIENNFTLLNTFLEKKILINNPKQIEIFLINNSKLIENCSIITKFNFIELDIKNINSINYYKSYIKYLSQKKIEIEGNIKNCKIKKEDMQNGLSIIEKNFSIIEKLKLEGINNGEFFSLLGNIQINLAEKKRIV